MNHLPKTSIGLPSLFAKWCSLSVAAFLTLLLPSQFVAAQDEETKQLSQEFQPREFLQQHCIKCHGTESAKADLDLESLNWEGLPLLDERESEAILGNEDWQILSRITEVLETEQMPPDDQTQPSSAQRQEMIAWLKASLDQMAKHSSLQEVVSAPRRLTNFEYQNTLQDLLGIEILIGDRLPKDPDIPYHFNNRADLLLLGMERMQSYEAIARQALAATIVEPSKPKRHSFRRDWKPEQNKLAITGNRRGTPKEGLRITSWPETGEYRIRMQASASFPGDNNELPLRLVMGYSLASDIGNAPFEVVGLAKLVNEPDSPQVFEFRGRIENHPIEPERKYRRGGTRTGNLVTTPAGLTITPQSLFDDGTLNDDLDPQTKPIANIDWIEFEAPVMDSWPPAHHLQILFDSPLRESDPETYIHEVLKRFMTRAFRGPVSDEEIRQYYQIYKLMEKEFPSVEAALRETLTFVLISPRFLYHNTQIDSPNYGVACKLSYFLWGSMPDQRLFDLAEQKLLGDPKVIEEEVARMLSDDRSRDFIHNFTMQWLAIAKARTIPINRNSFPRFLYTVKRGVHANEEVPFRPTIRDDMIAETVAFIGELIDQNLSVLNLIDSDFAMLNQRLAQHYGVEGVKGFELQRVPIEPQHHLGGLLTQGSVLIANSTGSAPHPIYRAVWIREAILGEEVKPPPADVPALSESAGEELENTFSIKEMLAKHRQKESCNACHARLDPWGIPFEQYNSIGKFQPRRPANGTRVEAFRKAKHVDIIAYQDYLQSIETESVDATAKLPNGPQVNGVEELKAYLLAERRHSIAKHVMSRLMTYSVGRELSLQEQITLDQLAVTAKQNDYKMRDMIVAICQSELFIERATQ